MKIEICGTRHKYFLEALSTIKKLYEKNNWSLQRLRIVLDSSLRTFGSYDGCEDIDTININLDKSIILDIKKRHNEFSSYFIVIHELSHLLAHKFNMEEKFHTEFKNDPPLILTSYNGAKKYFWENLADLTMLYIINPYLIKIVNKKYFIFFKKFFKPANPCSRQFFLKEWYSWDGNFHKTIYENQQLRVIKNNIYLKGKKI